MHQLKSFLDQKACNGFTTSVCQHFTNLSVSFLPLFSATNRFIVASAPISLVFPFWPIFSITPFLSNQYRSPCCEARCLQCHRSDSLDRKVSKTSSFFFLVLFLCFLIPLLLFRNDPKTAVCYVAYASICWVYSTRLKNTSFLSTPMSNFFFCVRLDTHLTCAGGQ